MKSNVIALSRKGAHMVSGSSQMNSLQRVTCILVLLFLLGLRLCINDCSAEGNPGVTVVFSNSKGQELCRIRAELALTDEEQMRGLMFRKDLQPDSGMLFVYGNDAIRSFWMKNTYIPLDMVFISSHNKVKHIYCNAKPFDETPISSRYPVQYILEIKAGGAKLCNIRTGSKMDVIHTPR